jgi:HD-GYP domain-containing protein (c-di-GMP phosphodiesterase class II)
MFDPPHPPASALADPIHPLGQALIAAVDERDRHTGEHCRRVCVLAVEVGRRAGLDAAALNLLHQAAALHDLGKIGIPDMVLLKPGRLDDDEWIVMRSHADRGARLITAAGLRDADTLATIVRHHHEHIDGSGYPDALRGDAIPLLSRIVALADSYDAMCEPRAYRDALPPAQALDIMRGERGTKFEHDLFALFEQAVAGVEP